MLRETKRWTIRPALRAGYPETDAVTMRLDMAQAANFALQLRVPVADAQEGVHKHLVSLPGRGKELDNRMAEGPPAGIICPCKRLPW